MKNISYIIATGWNRKISMFLDNTDSVIIYPTHIWPNLFALEKYYWHTDDILSMAFIPPSSVATSSYNGDIIIVNLNSGKITQRFNPHDNCDLNFPKQKRSIDKCRVRIVDFNFSVLFLSARNASKTATIVSCGGDGKIRFWHWQSGICYLEKDCTFGKNQAVYSMVSYIFSLKR